MSSDTLNEPQALEAAVGSVRLAGRGFSVTRIALGLVGIVLVWAAWQVSGGKIYKAGTGFGYFIGVTGAVMMLLMLLYPIQLGSGSLLVHGTYGIWDRWASADCVSLHLPCEILECWRFIFFHAAGGIQRYYWSLYL
jgi:hypothetical protein